MAEASDASSRRAPKRRITDQEGARKDAGPRLKQSVEAGMSALDKRMRRRGQIDSLTGKHVQFFNSLSEPLEVRQVGVKV
jgi:hypothetical protein